MADEVKPVDLVPEEAGEHSKAALDKKKKVEKDINEYLDTRAATEAMPAARPGGEVEDAKELPLYRAQNTQGHLPPHA